MKCLTVFTMIIMTVLLNTPIQSNDEMEEDKPENKPTERLECYVCNDCPTITINTTSKVCHPSVNGVSQSCLIYIERVIVTQNRHPLVIRGCSSERGTCAEIIKIDNMHKDLVELVSCRECSTNYCNTNSSVNRIRANLTTASFAIGILIALYFFFCNIVYPQISSPRYHTTLLHA